MRYGKRITVLLGLAVLALLPGFASLPVKGRGSVKAEGIGNPFEIRTQLREYTAYNPDTGIGAYGRYTELTAEEDAPETLKEVLEACNRRAEESVRLRADRAVWGEDGNAADAGPGTMTLGYIAAVTRADAALFSLLETEYEKGPSQADSDIICHFSGASYDTASGEEIPLSDLAGSEDACSAMLEDALAVRYGIKGLAGTGPSDYAWTADALGIRFYFHSDAVSKEKREELHDYTARAVTAGFSYADLPGKKAKTYAAAPDAYIAMIDRERTYSLPGNGPAGGLSVELTDQDGALVLCMTPEGGERQEWTIENADAASDFYIIRADGGFYLFRERIGWQEGFFYDLSRPDGGFGRLAYNTAQYFDSFLREILLALPYSPYCAHMAEVRRSFGESSYDKSSFVPHGHYRFPNDPDARYKRFLLKDEALQIDSGQTACRLLEDLEAFEEDADGNLAGETAVKAGSVLVFEDVRGEAARYNDPRKRSEHRTFVYGCRLADGQRICFESSTEGTVSAAKGYLNRFTEPVLKTEAASLAQAETAEPFMVSIGGKDYPVIPDYSHKDHTGEEIDFGGDLWWIAEGLPGRYVCTDEDLKEMRDDPYFPGDFSAGQAEGTELVIAEDGSTAFSFLGETFTGTLPEKRYYRTDAAVEMTSGTQTRTFWIIPREGGDHEAPVKIEFFSEGEPATNEPSKMPPVSVYLTKVRE